ncbi:codanin-1 [Schistocerca nitens]|uniref:codanin-1 n=1 Tax=Schistocerca nitens TaxID=7011 RepID=UPI0021186EDD|nr:codanin-1 [Schistocerca nitens]
MAAEILNEVLAGNVVVEDVIAWLTLRDCSGQSSSTLQETKCTRGAFILHFLNYLREETSSALKPSPSATTPLKPTKARAQNENFSSGSVLRRNSENKVSRPKKVELFPCNLQSKHTCEVIKNDKLNNIGNCASEETTICNSHSAWKQNSGQKLLEDELRTKTCHLENRDSPKSETKKKVALTKVDPSTPKNRFSQIFSPTDSPEHTRSIFSSVSPLSRSSSDPASPSHHWEKIQFTGKINKPCSTFSLNDFIVKDSNRSLTKKRGHRNQTHGHGFSNINEENVQPSRSQKRRIKPTRLITNQSEKPNDNQKGGDDVGGFGVIKRPIEPSTPFREVQVLEKPQPSSTSFQQERDLLRQERQKKQVSLKNCDDDGGREEFFPASVSPQSVQRLNPVLPQPDQVTCHEQLLSMSTVYSQLFNSGLLPNVTAEMHFITSLLVAEERTGEEKCVGYFGTVHNCVFFAVSVLDKLRLVLGLLDCATLQLLVSNKALELFSPDLHQHLQRKLQERDLEEKLKTPENLQSSVGNVTYRPDEDSRGNFPTDQAFYAFRKQRDAFYEMWQVWEAEHNQRNWSFSVALGARIRSLLALHRDPSNYIHLARLFRSQLLTTCRVPETDCEDDEVDDSMLAMLKDVNPKKYALLKARLIAPSKGSGPCPAPVFPGHQEFFKNFVLEASHSVFNKHLSDSLAHEILSLDCTDFNASDVGDTDTSVDESTKKEYQRCLCTLRLLAKFLGFVNFLPYHTVDNVPEKIHILHSSIRSKIPPPFDVLSSLQAAVNSHRMVLTVPWIVKYLAMLDTVSLRLPYYVSVLRLLFTVHRHHLSDLPNHSALLLRLCLGWLFDQPNFPEGLYFSWLSQQEREGVPEESVTTSSPLDLLHLVDEECVYMCCPFWGVLRATLAEDPHSRSHRSLRHITPVSADLGRQMQPTSTKQLELLLEENFFHGHPASMRKTVEFVAERVASAFVKRICNQFLPQQKKKDADKIRKLITESENDSNSINSPKTPKERATGGVEQIARLGSESLVKQAIQEMESFCLARITPSLSSLLSEDVTHQVVEACAGISLRLCKERVSNWVHLHITPDLFLKDYRMDVNKAFRTPGRTDISKASHLASTEIRKVSHNDTTAAPRFIINWLREIMWRLLTDHLEHVSASEVLALISETEMMLGSREDIISSAERIIHTLILDLILLLVAHQPKEVTRELIEGSLRLLKTPQLATALEEGRLERILSPRNVAVMDQSRDPARSWDHLALLLNTLLREQLMTPEQLEDQCVALLRNSWPQVTLDRFSTCIKHVIETYRKENKDKYDEFVMLMELVSELCDDMEQFDDF